MTFDELDGRYANGFVDTKLEAIRVDYAMCAAELQLRLRLEEPGDNTYSAATLRLSGLHYFVVEAPDGAERLDAAQRGLTVDGLAEDAKKFQLAEKFVKREGEFCCRFFVHDWNSFIHVAAVSAEFERV
jgi:hypothetical protein